MKEDPETRIRTMRAVKGENTSPELTVRHIVFAMGYRYRLHQKNLPGKPDLVFPGLHKVIFVNGCFWHGHDCARGARAPKTNPTYWREKIARNRARDKANVATLKSQGWAVATVWECELKNEERLTKRLRRFLG
jgi:DNA mismatch endonuclease (patch repair protein)